MSAQMTEHGGWALQAGFHSILETADLLTVETLMSGVKTPLQCVQMVGSMGKTWGVKADVGGIQAVLRLATDIIALRTANL